MEIFFRVDASIMIGTGHVMRCLTLADEMFRRGAAVHFICRDHCGYVDELILSKGYNLHLLSRLEKNKDSKRSGSRDMYTEWLGVSEQEDALQTCEVFKKTGCFADWLVVDHYALGASWHKKLRCYCRKLMVIDDLADRKYACDLLLDQTYARCEKEYQGLVDQHCNALVGSEYALLRPEFFELRPKAVEKRRSFSGVARILISMGASDPNNITEDILEQFEKVRWHKKPFLDVVLGGQAPHLYAVQKKARQHSLQVEVSVDVSDMAKRMLDADLAIGAAGSTSWERCCLGLPTVMMTLADNQKTIAGNLVLQEAAFNALDVPSAINKVQEIVSGDGVNLQEMSSRCFRIIDGCGVKKVCSLMGAG